MNTLPSEKLTVAKAVSQETVHIGRTTYTKIERYKWDPLNERGEFKLISKFDLIVDPVYQRERGTSEHLILGIARNWSWPTCGTLTVAERNQNYFIIDGNGRKLAADKRSDIDELPCMVFKLAGQEQEAEEFLKIQLMRKQVNQIDKFKVLLALHDPDAIIVRDEIERQGFRITRKGQAQNSISCMSTCVDACRADPDVFKRVICIACRICHDNSVHEEIVHGLNYLETMLKRQGQSIGTRDILHKLYGAGRTGILQAIAGAKSFYARGGPKVYAAGIVNIINYRRRSNIITIDATRD